MNSNYNYFETIFVHNLGSFDGYFIYKALSEISNPNQVNTIIDNKNKFILITFKHDNNESTPKELRNKIKFKWLDSYRIFPVKLDDLCKVFNNEGKLNSYKIEYNSINLFYNKILLEEFKNYSLQDSIALLETLIKAQLIYMKDFNINIIFN